MFAVAIVLLTWLTSNQDCKNSLINGHRISSNCRASLWSSPEAQQADHAVGVTLINSPWRAPVSPVTAGLVEFDADHQTLAANFLDSRNVLQGVSEP